MNIVLEFLKSKKNRFLLGAILASVGFVLAMAHAGAISAFPIVTGIVLLVSSQGASDPQQYN